MQVLNKYYPPDFDPELLPRNKKPKDRQVCLSRCLYLSHTLSFSPLSFFLSLSFLVPLSLPPLPPSLCLSRFIPEHQSPGLQSFAARMRARTHMQTRTNGHIETTQTYDTHTHTHTHWADRSAHYDSIHDVLPHMQGVFIPWQEVQLQEGNCAGYQLPWPAYPQVTHTHTHTHTGKSARSSRKN